MKKLMFAFAAIACAMAAHAVQYTWSTGPVLAYGEPDPYAEDAKWSGGTYYLMQGDATAAAAAVNAILAATDYKTEFANQVASAANYGTYSTETWTMSGAKVGEWSDAAGGVTWKDDTATGSLPFFQLILDEDNNGVYVSEIVASDYTTVGDTYISPGNTGYSTFGSDIKEYKGEGWYTAAAVPEPTSGLLLLLGVAGLALRRRRA